MNKDLLPNGKFGSVMLFCIVPCCDFLPHHEKTDLMAIVITKEYSNNDTIRMGYLGNISRQASVLVRTQVMAIPYKEL